MTNLISKAFEGHNIRIITDQQGEPWFVAADIAKVLEYTEASAMTRHLDDDEKGLSIVQTLGGSQELITINESGLYSAILRSRKPQAGGQTVQALGHLRGVAQHPQARRLSCRSGAGCAGADHGQGADGGAVGDRP